MILTPTGESLPLAMDHLNAFLEGAGCTPRVRMALETVVEEVFMNIANHSGATVAEFTLQMDQDCVVLRFSDDGIPYNPLLREAPDITLPASERNIGGLGVLMIMRMTDHQTYAHEGGRNVLTLFKRKT